MNKKIKVIEPQIVVHGTVDKPYYEICYYDIAKKEWCIGYSSYDLKNVVGWLNECFEVIEADVAPVKHGEWLQTNIFKCSECGYSFEPEGYTAYFNYCPNCGAKMDGKDDERNAKA